MAAGPFKSQCQYEFIVHKVEVYGFRPNNSSNNDSGNDLKSMFSKRPFKKDITTIEVFLHTKYIDTEQICLTTCRKLKRSKVWILY